MPIPKQYSVGCALFVQDKIFNNLVLHVLLTDEIHYGRDSHRLLPLIKTTLFDESGVVVFWYHQLVSNKLLVINIKKKKVMLIVNYMKINKSLLMQLFFNNTLKAYLCEL